MFTSNDAYMFTANDRQHRVHLDVRLDVDGDLDRLIALGATRQWEDPKGRWTVLADPEGNLFCAMYPAT